MSAHISLPFIVGLAMLLVLPLHTQAQSMLEGRAYSAAEITLLQELEEQRIQLERREQALELREKLIDLSEERLAQNMQDLEMLQQEITKLLDNLSDKEDEELLQLAQIYEAMKPTEAANIMNKLDNAIVYDILRRMNSKRSAKVMEQLAVPKARFISELMAEETPLPAFSTQEGEEL